MMNFFKSLLLLSSIVGLVSARSKSADIEGELTIEKYCGGDEKVKLECEWGAMASVSMSKSRRLRRNRKTRKNRRLKEVQVPDSHRVLSVELDDVECYLEVGDDDDEFHTELHFPEDFCVEKREADGADDFFVFTAKVEFDGTDIEGEIEVEIELIDDTEEAVYDDSSISIDCD